MPAAIGQDRPPTKRKPASLPRHSRSRIRKLIATGFIVDAKYKLGNEALIADLDRRIEAKFAQMI